MAPVQSAQSGDFSDGAEFGAPTARLDQFLPEVHPPTPFIALERDGRPSGPVILAGPTCDSADILYRRRPYELTLDLAIGDPIDFSWAGACTGSVAAVAFNGFPPIRSYFVQPLPVAKRAALGYHAISLCGTERPSRALAMPSLRVIVMIIKISTSLAFAAACLTAVVAMPAHAATSSARQKRHP